MKIRICAITGRVHLSSAVIMKRFSRVTFNSSRPYLHKRIILDMGSMFGFSDILDYLLFCFFFFFFFLKKTSTFCFKKTPTIQTDPMTIWLVKVQVYHTSFNAPLGLEKIEVEGIPKLSTRNNTKYMPIFTDHAYVLRLQ